MIGLMDWQAGQDAAAKVDVLIFGQLVVQVLDRALITASSLRTQTVPVAGPASGRP